jgi:cell division protein ZapA
MPEERIDKLHIRLRVYDTELPVRIFREEEEMYRDAAKLITDTINIYHNRVSAETSEKMVMYMALVDIALRYEREMQRNDTARYEDILYKITSEVEQALGERPSDISPTK